MKKNFGIHRKFYLLKELKKCFFRPLSALCSTIIKSRPSLLSMFKNLNKMEYIHKLMLTAQILPQWTKTTHLHRILAYIINFTHKGTKKFFSSGHFQCFAARLATLGLRSFWFFKIEIKWNIFINLRWLLKFYHNELRQQITLNFGIRHKFYSLKEIKNLFVWATFSALRCDYQVL